MDEAEGRMLRAKYLDWCSARIAERFLDLTPDEIYELAHPVAEEAGRAGGAGGAGITGVVAEGGGRGAGVVEVASPSDLPAPHEESYRHLVQRVTESLLGRMSLPTFEQWAEAYAESPSRFDVELLGFWKEVAGSEPELSDGAD